MGRAQTYNPEHARLLASPSWSRCEERIKAFEEAWQTGQSPAIADYLDADGPLRQALLAELAHVDLEFRLKSGADARVETYLGLFPELEEDRSAVLELIAAEFELRHRYQGPTDPEEFSQRFPGYASDLSRRLVNAPDAAVTRIDRTPPRLTGAGQAWPTLQGYEVEAELGRGGMGVIYKAIDLRLGRTVALKFLPAEYARDTDRLERFQREARTASALNHPGICTIHGLGEHEGRPFIVMEFIAGPTLQELVGQRPGVETVARLIGQAARALAVAHAAGIVHRDIKPDNIMVREDGYVKVVDFGLARHTPTLALAGLARHTSPGTFLGTVAYMSPEQARSEPVESPSDVFSLGIVLYELATGVHPFEAETSVGMLQAIASRRPVPPSRLNPEVPAALEALLEAMLHKDPRERPSAGEVDAALNALGGQGATWGLRAAPAGVERPTVGRLPELAKLRAALDEAERGRGAMLCISGEPGIGKSTLVEGFLRALVASGRPCFIGRGRCCERLAGAEAYLPVVEAVEDLFRSEPSGSVARLMKVVAPTWYVQVAPSRKVRSEEEGSEEKERGCCAPHPSPLTSLLTSQASTQQALLREFGRFLEEVARLAPLVLFFDDVHWADVSTVDLLAHLALHSPGRRVLVLVTYRPTELLLGPHPFHRVKLELQGHGACREVPLGFLGREDIDSYLARAFPGHDLPADFAGLIHARTEGNPLFMADLLRYLRERGVIAEADGRWRLVSELPEVSQELPESVRSMIQRKIDQLSALDRKLLTAAALLGYEFDSAVVAGALALDPAEVEERLCVLDRVHGLVRLVREYELPDRTLTLRHRFVHVLYQHALQADLTPTRRTSLATALAATLEKHHGESSPGMAIELACLYETGRDFARAAGQLCLAARHAARIFAHQEAIALARRGLGLLDALPDSPERSALELPLQVVLGMQLQVTQGFAAPLAKQAYTRARELCQRVSGAAEFPVLWGLWLYRKNRSELATAREMAGELLDLARRQNDPSLALQAQQALAVTTLCRGEPVNTLGHMEEGAALYDSQRHSGHSWQFGQDPGVACKAFGAVALWLLGYPDEAARQSNEAVRLSLGLSQPSSQALAYHFAAMLHHCRRDGRQALACADASWAIAAEQRFSFWLAGATVMRGWALALCGAADNGIAQMRQGLADWQATGSVTYRTYYLGLLAEVLWRQGKFEEGARVTEEALALVARTGEGLYEAELHRLQGELLLGMDDGGSAGPEGCFRRALEVARRQEARSLELRAAVSLARLVRTAEARSLLADVLAWFREGSQTPDLQEARGLLDSLA